VTRRGAATVAFGVLVAGLAAWACGGPRAASGPVPVVAQGNNSAADAGEEAEAQISALLDAAFEAEPGAGADSAFAPFATLIANGGNALNRPRFAGMGLGGQAAVIASQVEVRSGLAWAVVDYRWISADGDRAHTGRATVILAPRSGGRWWIVHAHSSAR
jgi:hypothetical protein